jgi:predicted nucleic acid-binding protein
LAFRSLAAVHPRFQTPARAILLQGVWSCVLAYATSYRTLFMSVVNWGEIYYSVMRGVSPEMAEQKAREIAAMPIEIVAADLHQTHQAAIYKATHKMSYADCFAAALAKIKNSELLTGDPEFKALEKEIKINWLK